MRLYPYVDDCYIHVCIHIVITQWGIDTVYQEDYSSLLYATETGRKITYTPSNIVELIQPFSQYVTAAVDEVSDWIL